MQKPYYTLEAILNMELPPIIIWAVPVMVSLVILEYIIRAVQMREKWDVKDTWAAIAVGIGNLLSSALFKTILFTIILFCYNLVPWYIPHTWWSYILCFVVLDFCRYWAHRISHEQRFWWATHVTHHSSEQYNFTVSFRLSWVQHIKIVFFIPIPLLGFDPFVFFICNQLAVLYQFWLHTELIKKLPKPIEYIFTTPSHHRVHHGRDDKYMDKNYGSTLIIFDRIFGTFYPEEEKPDYGITKPPKGYNPAWLVFHEFVDIFRDMAKYRSLKAWWLILFGSPGHVMDKSAYDINQQKKPASEEPLNPSTSPLDK